MTEFNWIDMVAISIIGLSMLYGLFRGFIMTVFSLAGMVVGFFVSKNYGGTLTLSLTDILGDSFSIIILGYVISFLSVVALFLVVSLLLKKLVALLKLGIVDSLGGLFFGFVRGAFFMVLIILVLSITPIVSTTSWQSALAVSVGGTIIKTSLQIPFFNEYQEVVTFDSQNRPKIEVAAASLLLDKTPLSAEELLKNALPLAKVDEIKTEGDPVIENTSDEVKEPTKEAAEVLEKE